MDTIVRKPCTPLNAVPRWSPPEDDPLSSNPEHENGSSQIGRFPFRVDLNRRIALWKGPITRLEVDAIVNSSNEPLTDITPIGQTIYKEAGPELQQEVFRLDGCRTGEAKITKGYNLPARHVIHTVGPRFNPKYQTAAENALHNCYRSCLQLLKENALKSIAFQVINSEKRGYPPENGAHIAIRTVRRFLERFGEDIDLVIFCMDRDEDIVLYSSVLPLYFPRSSEEQSKVSELLPADTGNETGETVIEERKIRINATPITPKGDDAPAAQAEPSTLNQAREEMPDESLSAGRFLSTMYGDPDIKKIQNRQANPESEDERLYRSLLRRSRTEDLSDLVRLQYIYQSGCDKGRNIVVWLGVNTPRQNEERTMMYIVKTLAAAAEKDFMMFFFVDADWQPSLSFMKQLVTFFELFWCTRLLGFYIVHAGVMFRITMGMAKLLSSDRFSSRVFYLDSLREVHALVDHVQVKVNDGLVSYDQRLNRYTYTAPESQIVQPKLDLDL